MRLSGKFWWLFCEVPEWWMGKRGFGWRKERETNRERETGTREPNCTNGRRKPGYEKTIFGSFAWKTARKCASDTHLRPDGETTIRATMPSCRSGRKNKRNWRQNEEGKTEVPYFEFDDSPRFLVLFDYFPLGCGKLQFRPWFKKWFTLYSVRIFVVAGFFSNHHGMSKWMIRTILLHFSRYFRFPCWKRKWVIFFPLNICNDSLAVGIASCSCSSHW